MQHQPILYYIHDPMCSWCWGFSSSWKQLRQKLGDDVQIQSLLGGLAADSDQVMPLEMQANIRDNWRLIEKTIAGVRFNFDFWEYCQPRRSTYAACRAVIAARQQDFEAEHVMITGIQQAYYQLALNPSDDSVLIELAKNMQLDVERFAVDLLSVETNDCLQNEMSLCRSMGVSSFPSLLLKQNSRTTLIQIDYNNADVMLAQINDCLISQPADS